MASTWALGRFWGSIRDVWKEINPATLTGAVDVIVVEQPNGDLVCSPFHVRFGKMGVLRSKEKVVDIAINEVPSTIQMKLSDSGEAFFVESVDGGDEVPMHLATSPLPVSSMELMKRGLESLRAVDPGDMSREASAPPGLPVQSSTPIEIDPTKANDTKTSGSDQGSPAPGNEPSPSGSSSQKPQPPGNIQMRRQDTMYQSCTNELPGLDKKTLQQLLMTRRRSDYGAIRGTRGRSRSWNVETNRGARKTSTISQPVAITPSAKKDFRDGQEHLRHSRSYAPSSLRKVSCAPTLRGGNEQNPGMVTRPSSNWRTPPEATPAISPSMSAVDTRMDQARKAQFSMNDDIFQMDADDEGEDTVGDDKKRSGKSSGGITFKAAPEKPQAVVAHAVDGALGAIVNVVPTATTGDDTGSDSESCKEDNKDESGKTESGLKGSESDFAPTSDNDEDGSRSPSPTRSEDEAAKLERVIKEGDALGKVLNQAGGSDSDTSVWRWAKKNSDAQMNQKPAAAAANDSQTGWNLFGFMRRPERQQANADGGIYLGDLLKGENVDPQLVDRYMPKRNFRRSESGTGQQTVVENGTKDSSSGTMDGNPAPSPRSDHGYGSNPSSVIATDDHRRWFFDEGRFQELLGDVSISLCGGLDQHHNEISDDQFNAQLITYDQLNNNPDLIFDPNLVLKMNGKYYNWRVAGPMIVSLLLFQQPLSESAVNTLINKHQPKAVTHEARDTSRKNSASSGGYSSYFWWRRATSADPPAKTEEPKKETGTDQQQPKDTSLPSDATNTSTPSLQVPEPSRQSPSALSSSFEFDDRGALSDSELEETRRTTHKARFKKTLYLTSDQLKSLNLKHGVPNKACFSVTTKYQGTTICECEIYLWRYNDKIIISDIDGTITKSDVLGHIIPRVGGGHWAHIGVAELFNRIIANDYKIMYLTARAIGMASQTKEYLQSVQQDKFSLPPGPLLLSPTSVFNALHREVIEKKPEIFKTSCLRDIASLFPAGINPFFAGFGNRPNDTVAYTAAGVPANRIYIIDPTGRVEFTAKKLEFSYPKISDLVDHLFPPLHVAVRKVLTEQQAVTPAAPEEFNVSQYWRNPMADVEVDLDKFPKPGATGKTSTKSSTSSSTSQGWTKKK